MERVINWEDRLASLLPLYGHRNWIVIADSAYPAQSKPGIETLFTGCEHAEVLGAVLDAISSSIHVRANAFVDAELKLLTETDAPGVSVLRHELNQRLAAYNKHELMHERLIRRIDQAGILFRILILKTTLAIPYSSVFLELNCGYWSDNLETRLRNFEVEETVSEFPPG